VRLLSRLAHRLDHERRKRTIRSFHRIYYGSPWQTWKNTRWLGVKAYKTPLDLWVYQELIASLRPQLIVETGTADGGSALFLATVCDAVGCGEIVTIDSQDLPGRRAHERITYVTGSSVAPETRALVAERAEGLSRVLIILDADHSRDHVLEELRRYAELVTPGSYLVVEDTNLNGHPVLPTFGPGPMEAIQTFLAERPDFQPDSEQEKFLLTFNPGGYLRRAQAHGATAAAPAPRARPLTARVAAGLAAAALILVGLPELFGDHPYDPRPSTWPVDVSQHL
jgi:cephalosporin hydroxylase